MTEINREHLVELVANLCIEANLKLPQGQMNRLKLALENEKSLLGRKIIAQIIENSQIASRTRLPICQDCGVAVVFVDLGRDAHISFDLYEAIDEGVAKGYKEGHLRPSMLRSCTDRGNTFNNTPAVTHLRLVEGGKVKVTVAPKGGGSENASRVSMLKPYEGEKGIMDFVVETVRQNGPSACPPLTVGVGLGGTIEYCAELAKRALLVEERSKEFGQMEEELLELCNGLGFGPGGTGGSVSVLDVHVLATGCHIATMPVAVNIQCHAARHASGELP